MTDQERAQALSMVTSVMERCGRAQLKFAPGTAQFTLLKNRLAAMEISKVLLAGESPERYSDAALHAALEPVASILRKCEKARGKYQAGAGQYQRFDKIVRTMQGAQALIREEIQRRGGAVII